MSVPSFQASLTDEMQSIVDKPRGLVTIIAEEQRPVSVSLPQSAVDNALIFKNTLRDASIETRIFLAHKATPSLSIMKSLRGVTSIDVASEAELDDALQIGYEPEAIIATGPKTNRFLKRLLDLPGTTIVIDSDSELERLLGCMSDRPTSILLRLSRTILNRPGITKKSRFGLDQEGLDKSLRLLKDCRNIRLKGLAFHLDSQSIDDRQYAVQIGLQTVLEVQQQGFVDATVLDIGGGYGTDYGVRETESARFESTIKRIVAGKDPSITWQDRSYGLRSNGGHLSGELTGVDLVGGPVGVDRLMAILALTDETGTSMAHQLSENLIELWIEPGSALCASAGLFAAEVIEVTQRDGEYMVIVDAHRNQVCFEGSEHVADPILIPADSTAVYPECDAYIAGHLCMETDFMTFRKIHFNQMPQPGDVIVWTYTGAYRSHFSTSQSIGHPLPARYTFTSNKLLTKDTV